MPLTRTEAVAMGLSELLAEHGMVDGANKFTASEIAQRCAMAPSEVGKVLKHPVFSLAEKLRGLGHGKVTVQRVKAEGHTWAEVRSA